jgi:hypothetical protein
MSMDGRLIAFADTLDIDIWASDDRGRLRTIKTRDVVDHVCFTPDASRIVAATALAEISVWETDTGRNVPTFEVGESSAEGCLFSGDSRRMATVWLTITAANGDAVWRVTRRTTTCCGLRTRAESSG